jgi:MinD superfamily P-loop ATPase
MEQHLIISPEMDLKILVLSGMGGCGKTQMAAYFVKRHHFQ